MNQQSKNEKLLLQAFAKLDKIALSVALGTVFGFVVFVATMVLVVRGGDDIGPNLALLGQFFIGYEVSFWGSFVGLGYGFAMGFLLGWIGAFLHNLFVRLYLMFIQFRSNLGSITDFIDPDHSKTTNE